VATAYRHWNSLTLEDALRVAPFVHSVEVSNHSCKNGTDRGAGFCLLGQTLGYVPSAKAASTGASIAVETAGAGVAARSRAGRSRVGAIPS